jgi:hypothetical protein
VNLILEKTDEVPFFTNMESVFHALKIPCQDYDWYLSDLDTSYYPEGFSPRDQWMTGKELSRLISGQNFQFNWGVFSAVPKGFHCEIEDAPFADGNSAYWIDPDYHPQLRCALFEITCWDSSATILAGISPEAAANFLRAFPDTRPLSDHTRTVSKEK